MPIRSPTVVSQHVSKSDKKTATVFRQSYFI